nr:uncharacterized protein LOC108946135 [Nicotiana tomentosiformis]
MINKFLGILSQIQLNFPLVDVLREIPKYAKYIKDIVANKRRLTEFEIVALTKECISRIQRKLPQRLKDPGSFTIPIRIGEVDVGRALCDLGDSINLMPLSVFGQLGFGSLRSTTVILQLADRSIVYPEWEIEDVLLQIWKFILPVDFIILDNEVDEQVSIILGRPPLATTDDVIKLHEGKMILRVDNVEAFFMYTSINLDDEVKKMVHHLDACAYIKRLIDFEPLDRPIGPSPKSSIDNAPKLELKSLTSHIHYAYLGVDETLHIVVSSDLSVLLEEKLLRVLREHKRAIEWTTADIHGIS